MASDIRARVAIGTAQVVTATRTINLADGKVGSAIRDACRAVGINVEGVSDVDILTAWVDHLAWYTGDKARAYRELRDLAAQLAAAKQTIAEDTAL